MQRIVKVRKEDNTVMYWSYRDQKMSQEELSQWHEEHPGYRLDTSQADKILPYLLDY